jgi:ATP-binding cassette subfamily C protein
MKNLAQQLDLIKQATPVDKVFWLDQQYSSMDLLKTGAIDIFLQKRDNQGQAEGPRFHLYRLEIGHFLFGKQQIHLPDQWGLLAVRLAATYAWQLTPQEFSDVLQNPQLSSDMLECINQTIIITLNALSEEPPPAKYTAISLGEKLQAAPEEVLSPNESMIWAMIHEGRTSWRGKKEFTLDRSTELIPLTRETFLVAQTELLIEAVNHQFLSNHVDLVHKALLTHHRIIALEGIIAVELKNTSEALKLANMPTLAKEAFNQATAKLMGVVHKKLRLEISGSRKIPLLSALKPIGKVLGISFKEPHPSELNSKGFEANPLAFICNSSDVRYRKVALVERWWETDNGPILCQLEGQEQWVALLPFKDKSYQIFNPITGQTQAIRQDNINDIGNFGFVFYRSFPNKKITPLGLMMFGAQGMSRDLYWVLAVSILIGLLAMVTPIASGMLIDSVIPSADKLQIWEVVFALLIAGVASTMFEIAALISLLRIESKMDGSIQSAVWDRVLKLPVTFFKDYSTGDLASRISGINTIRHALSGATIRTILGGLFSFFNFGLLFHYNAELAKVATLLVLFVFVFSSVIGFLKLRYERQVAEVFGKLSSSTFQYLTGLTKIRVFSAESQVFSRWADAYSQFCHLTFNTRHLANIEHTFFSGFPLMISAVFFSMMGMFIFEHHVGNKMSSGSFIAFNAAFGTFMAGIISLLETFMNMLNLLPVYERAIPILHALPEVNDTKTHPGEIVGAIQVDKLSFRYGEGQLILNDISLKIHPGEYVALVGPSGSGKSTLLRLLLGFEKPSTGSIYYDNQDMAELDINALRRQFGVVLQNAQLMPTDIISNIIGSSNLTVEDAWEAAKMVGLDDDIKKMPMGMYTVIGEGGTTFSGGQRQRMIIAKAIVHRPRILFFDEATSALDNHTQATVTQSLDQFKSTRIVIAHRMSTIMNADRIIVLDGGKMIQEGTYDELIAVEGLFQELASRQVA